MRYAVIASLLLGGCASAPQQVEVQKVVTVPGPTQYIPLPPALFAGCLRPAPRGPLNGDLLLHDLAESQYALCLEAELASIQTLKAPQ